MSHRYMSVWVYHDGRTHLPVLQPWEEAIVEVYKLPLEKQCEGLTALKKAAEAAGFHFMWAWDFFGRPAPEKIQEAAT